MNRRHTIIPLLLGSLLALSLGACMKQIGDPCTTNLDCDRKHICDSTQPDGYCTMLDCTRDSCPLASVCVDFFQEGVYVRSACMADCQEDGDCRSGDGYVCRTDARVPYCGTAR